MKASPPSTCRVPLKRRILYSFPAKLIVLVTAGVIAVTIVYTRSFLEGMRHSPPRKD